MVPPAGSAPGAGRAHRAARTRRPLDAVSGVSRHGSRSDFHVGAYRAAPTVPRSLGAVPTLLLSGHRRDGGECSTGSGRVRTTSKATKGPCAAGRLSCWDLRRVARLGAWTRPPRPSSSWSSSSSPEFSSRASRSRSPACSGADATRRRAGSSWWASAGAAATPSTGWSMPGSRAWTSSCATPTPRLSANPSPRPASGSATRSPTGSAPEAIPTWAGSRPRRTPRRSAGRSRRPISCS